MGRDRVLLLFFAALLSLLFCAIGLLLRKKDIFSMLNDPRVDKYPKTFQDIRTVMILFSGSGFSVS